MPLDDDGKPARSRRTGIDWRGHLLRYYHLAAVAGCCIVLLPLVWGGPRFSAKPECTVERVLQLPGGVVTFPRNGFWWHGFALVPALPGEPAPLIRAHWAAGPAPDDEERRWAVVASVSIVWRGDRPVDGSRIGRAPRRCRR